MWSSRASHSLHEGSLPCAPVQADDSKIRGEVGSDLFSQNQQHNWGAVMLQMSRSPERERECSVWRLMMCWGKSWKLKLQSKLRAIWWPAAVKQDAEPASIILGQNVPAHHFILVQQEESKRHFLCLLVVKIRNGCYFNVNNKKYIYLGWGA